MAEAEISVNSEVVKIEDNLGIETPKRIVSLDAIRGFAIIMIMAAHIGSLWLDSDWRYIYAMVQLSLEFLGPEMFVLLSVLSGVFSIKSKQGKISERAIRTGVFMRATVIFMFGLFYNIIAVSMTIEGVPFPLNLWSWNILIFIAFSQIFAYYALKLKRNTRVVILLIVILSSDFFRLALYAAKDSNIGLQILHYIIISPAPSVTVIPWISATILITIFGEALYDAIKKGTKEAYMDLFKYFMRWGLILVLAGIAIGFPLHNDLPFGITMSEAEYNHIYLFDVLNSQNYYQFAGLPLYLIRGTGSNILFNTGLALITIAIGFYLIDIKEKNNSFLHMLNFYGHVSLSLFLIHHAFLTFYVFKFNIIFFLFTCITFIGFMGIMMYIWFKFAGGVGSPEWLVKQMLSGSKKKKRPEKSKKEI